MLKICQIPDGLPYPPDGANTRTWAIHRLSVALAKLGTDVEVITSTRPRGQYPYLVVPLVRYPPSHPYTSKFLFGLLLNRKLPHLISERNYSVIHYYGVVAPVLASLAVKKKAPSVVTWGDPYIGTLNPSQGLFGLMSARKPENSVARFAAITSQLYLLHHVDKIVAVSYFLKGRISKIYGVENSKIEVIHPGVDTNFFRPGLSSFNLRRRYNMRTDDIVIMCPARITPIKSQLDIVEALPRILKEFKSAKLLLVGQIQDTKYAGKISRRARDLSLREHVTFTGVVSGEELPLFYCLADLIVLPSKSEGLASSLLEAMSCGKPIVASDIQPNREAALKGEEIVFYSSGDTAGLADTINRLLGDNSLREKIGNAGRLSAVNHYGWRNVAKNHTLMYEKLTSSPIE